MRITFVKAGLLALIAVAGMSFSATTASADPNVRFGIYVNDGHRGNGWGAPPPRRHHAQNNRRAKCNAGMAEQKASRLGLRRARVVEVTPRRVVVAGMSRHGRDRMVFANERGCPVIRR